MSAIVPQKVQARQTTSYLLWLGWLFGIGGLHRLYNGKIASGLLWFCTFGLFGFGQLIDLFLIPDMAEQRYRQIFGDRPSTLEMQPVVAAEVSTKDTLMVQLLRLAKLHEGQITVTQAVMETGQSFETIEAELTAMVKSGYADISNRPDSGVVIYEFPELM